MSETTPGQLAEILRQLAPMLDSVARQIDVVQAHEGRIADLERELPALRHQLHETRTTVRALEDQLAKMTEAAVFTLARQDREAGA